MRYIFLVSHLHLKCKCNIYYLELRYAAISNLKGLFSEKAHQSHTSYLQKPARVGTQVDQVLTKPSHQFM